MTDDFGKPIEAGDKLVHVDEKFRVVVSEVLWVKPKGKYFDMNLKPIGMVGYLYPDSWGLERPNKFIVARVGRVVEGDACASFSEEGFVTLFVPDLDFSKLEPYEFHTVYFTKCTEPTFGALR